LLSSPITLTPSSSPFFTLLTLPALLHQAQGLPWQTLKKVISLSLGSTLGSVYTNWDALPKFGAGVQSLLSLLLAAYVGLIIKIHDTTIGKTIGSDDWVVSPLFGLVWAGMWFAWSRFSPLGRYVNALLTRIDSDTHGTGYTDARAIECSPQAALNDGAYRTRLFGRYDRACRLAEL
jgi:hypothetical protein